MFGMKKYYILSVAVVIAVCAIAVSPSFGAEPQTDTRVVKKRFIKVDTITADHLPAAKDGVQTAEPPFQGTREKVPAGSAVMSDSSTTGPDVVNYASSVVSRTPNELILNTTISKVEDDETLNELAGKVYLENSGQNYNNVVIFWHVGANPEPAAPWGRTDISKGSSTYKVVHLQ